MSSYQKKEKAQAMVSMFIFISVVAMTAIFVNIYAMNQHSQIIHAMRRAVAFYAGEAAIIYRLDQLRTNTGAQDGITVADVTFYYPDTSLIPGAPLVGVNPYQFRVDLSTTHSGDGNYLIEAEVRSQ